MRGEGGAETLYFADGVLSAKMFPPKSVKIILLTVRPRKQLLSNTVYLLKKTCALIVADITSA